MYSDNFKDTQD